MTRRTFAGLAGLLGLAAAAACGQLTGLSSLHDGICTPGATQECPYTGPAGTQNVGNCKAAVQVCSGDGESWGVCTGEVLPQAATSCLTAEAETCTADPAPGCCTPGATTACYDGDAGTEGVGLCKGGTVTCGTDGKPGATCAGEVTPTQETCSNPADENCDGYDCVEWVDFLGDSALHAVSGVAVDGAGNVVVVGTYSGAITVGSTTLTNLGTDNIFLIKLDPTGKPIWGQSYGDTGTQQGGSISLDSTGNIFFSGCSSAAFSLAGAALPPGDFLAKFGSDGKTLAWAKNFGTNTCTSGAGSNQLIAKIATTLNNDVVIVGAFPGSVNFGAGADGGNGTITAKGTTDGFVAHLGGAQGSAQASSGGWVITFGSAGVLQEATDVAVNPSSGDIHVVGDFYGTLSFSNNPAVTSQGDKDVFYARLGDPGYLEKLSTFGDIKGQSAAQVAVDPLSGGYAFTGTFNGSISFGNNQALTTTGGQGFVVRFDSTDVPVWSNAYGDGSSLPGWESAGFDMQGNLALTGYFFSTINFGGGALMNGSVHPNVFLAKLAHTGSQLWAKSFGTMQTTVISTMHMAPTGEVVLGGAVQGPINFGTGPLTTTGTPAFVAKFGL